MFEEPIDDIEAKNNQETSPNNTLYINNLNEKVPMDELKDTLFEMFEEFGEILDVSISNSDRRQKKYKNAWASLHRLQRYQLRNGGQKTFQWRIAVR